MRRLSFALALLAVAAAVRLEAQDDTLRVLRHAPSDTATVSNIITVTFDRPVAGRLDATVPAAKLIRIEPMLAGHAEWRDPVTIRFIPDEPIAPGSAFTVTIDTALRAVDGSRLARPYRFSFRVPGPRIIGRSFGGDYADRPAVLPYNGKLALLYSAPVDLDMLRRGIRFELPNCADKRGSHELRVVGQHPVGKGDPYSFGGAGGWDRDTTGDRFRRVVELETVSPLPENCAGFITLPTTADDAVHGRGERYAVRTAPPFTLESFDCSRYPLCNNDALTIRFSASVKAADLARYARFEPAVTFEFREGVDQGSVWSSAVRLAPKTTYTVIIDPALRDVEGRPITGPLRKSFTTGDHLANIGYAGGLVTLPADGARSIPLRHINVQSVRVTTWFIPEAKRARALSLARYDLPKLVDSLAESRDTATIALHASRNAEGTTEIPLPEKLLARRDGILALRVEIAERMTPVIPAPPRATKQRNGTLSSVVVIGESQVSTESPIALLQRTRLTVNAKLGSRGAVVAVTGIGDAQPRAGATVRALDSAGAVLAESRTGSDGIATLHFSASSGDGARRPAWMDRVRYRLIDVRTDSDRATLPIGMMMGRYFFWAGNPLDAWALGGRSEDSPAITATLFADRGIYRPGEMLYLKGVVRSGILGGLKVPPRQEVRLTVVRPPARYGDDDDPVVIRDTVLTTNEFGTLTDSLRLRLTAPLGSYLAELTIGTGSDSTTIAHEEIRIAEYRAPEFLVTAATDSAPRYSGDTVRVAVAARYLFGAPMGRAPVQWDATLHELRPWEIRIPGAEGWTVGEWDWTSPARGRESPNGQQGTDTLDAGGQVQLRIPLEPLHPSAPGRVDVSVAVTDLNQQAVTATTSFPVHPARLYVLAKRATRGWYWTVGKPATVQLRTVTPEGTPAGARVVVAVVRRRWQANGGAGAWRDTTLRIDTVRTTTASSSYTFTPSRAGRYELRLRAADGQGGTARTTLSGWAIESGRRWGEGPPYALSLIASAREASVGDEVEVAFESPFDSAEAWVTVEREQVLESRWVTVHRGVNTIPLRISAAHVPNVFLSVLLSAVRPPGGARPGSATDLMRAGYVEIAVRTDAKRLAIAVMPRDSLYAPGDRARVRVRVTDAMHRGARSEVTLWAVDEGVLALTGYTTPDLIARLYEPRGIGQALWSSWPTLLLAAPEFGALRSGISLRVAGSTAALSEVVVGQAGGMTTPRMRTEFRSTAFYLGSAVTDDSGAVDVAARVPDNLTTYRVMAVAVSADDRFGSGDTTLLVTRQLVARPALPRFVRAADTLRAGAVVNARDGSARNVTVNASSEGMSLNGAPTQSLTLAAGRGAAARFSFAVPPRESAPDTVVVRLRATDGRNGDAVETRLPVEADFHPRTHTEIGSLRDRADVLVDLPGDIDAARSRLSLRIGSSPLVPMLAAWDGLRDYPYDCTEQLASTGRALVAIWRAAGDGATRTLGSDPRPRAQRIADALIRRQRADGGIRYWDDHEWTSPWLTAYAGLYLLDAREQGIAVDSAVLRRAAAYLSAAIDSAPADTGGMNRSERRVRRLALGNRVAVVEFLRRAGHADVKAEDALLRLAPVMTWEDRLRLAEALARRPDARGAAGELVDAAWRAVTRAGKRVDLPDSSHADREFPSRIAPAARLLSASIALRPDHQLLGGLVETVLQQGRGERGWAWNTQDYASVVMAMAALTARGEVRGTVTMSAAGRELVSRPAGASGGSEEVPLAGLLVRAPNGRMQLPLRLTATTGAPVFYALSVEEVPSKAPVTPDIQGIVVERWYERFDNGQPVTSLAEGDLVRVRLRVTVPADREFVAVEDPLPAGLEPVDLSLKTSGTLQPFVTPVSEQGRRIGDRESESSSWQAWLYGRWEDGWWSPWEHKAIHDDKVVWFARMLWPGSYSASYVARATTTGSFVRPPAHAEEMYNPALQGRSDGGRFIVEEGKGN